MERCVPPQRPFGVGGAGSAFQGPRNAPPPAPPAGGGRAQPGVWQTPPRVESFASGRFRKRLRVGGPRTGKSGCYGEPDARVPSPRRAAALGPRRRSRLLPLLLLLLLLLLPPPPRVGGFNLDAEAPAVLSGPPGSFFGFSVEFYRPGTDG